MQCAEGARPTTKNPSQNHTVDSERSNCEERKLMIYYEILNYAYWAPKSSERATVTIKKGTYKTSFENANKPKIRNDKSSDLHQTSFVS